MALIPQLTLVAASTTNEQIAVQESTGAYNITTNPGGYGGGDELNPAASDVAQFLFAFKKNFSEDDVNLTSLIDNTLSENGDDDKIWTLDITDYDDGWYKFYLLVCPIYDAAVSYDTNQIVSYNNGLWKSLQDANVGNTPVEGVNWTAVNTADTVANLETILDSASNYGNDDASNVRIVRSVDEHDLMLENSEIFLANQIGLASTECDGCSDLADEVKEIETVEFYLRAAYANEAAQNWTRGAKNIEILKSIRDGETAVC